MSTLACMFFLPASDSIDAQVVEDVSEGPVVTGLSTRVAKNAEELRSLYNSGRANRDSQVSRWP
jgi:hypothetical protein